MSTGLLPSVRAHISSRNHGSGPFKGGRTSPIAMGYEESDVVQPACGLGSS